MKKITEMIVSAILKRGVLCDTYNCDMEIEIPPSQLGLPQTTNQDKIKIRIKADSLTITVNKD